MYRAALRLSRQETSCRQTLSNGVGPRGCGRPNWRCLSRQRTIETRVMLQASRQKRLARQRGIISSLRPRGIVFARHPRPCPSDEVNQEPWSASSIIRAARTQKPNAAVLLRLARFVSCSVSSGGRGSGAAEAQQAGAASNPSQASEQAVGNISVSNTAHDERDAGENSEHAERSQCEDATLISAHRRVFTRWFARRRP